MGKKLFQGVGSTAPLVELIKLPVVETFLKNSSEVSESSSPTVNGKMYGSFLRPVPGKVTSKYGMRMHPTLHYMKFHTGIDLRGSEGSPIKAAADGIVYLSQRLGSLGNAVKIDHGDGISTVYGHASKLLVKVGQKVLAGEVIALVGNTGRSTGPHLHFEVRVNGVHVNPPFN